VGDEVRPQPQNVDRDAYIPTVNPPQDQLRRDNPQHVDGAPMRRYFQLPKGLKYDGKENLLGFKHKFNRYYQVRQWTPDEARDNFCWCLEGKANEFYATVVALNPNVGFVELLTKLEKRFEDVQLPDTAHVQLSNSKQKPDKSIEDWADRVLQLCVRAFPDLPEEYMYRQAIKRICHGCIDRKVGQYVVNLNLHSVELTIDKIKSYQFNHQSIYERGRKEVRELAVSQGSDSTSDDEDHTRSHKVRQTSQRQKN
jgi:hypothetical protein